MGNAADNERGAERFRLSMARLKQQLRDDGLPLPHAIPADSYRGSALPDASSSNEALILAGALLIDESETVVTARGGRAEKQTTIDAGDASIVPDMDTISVRELVARSVCSLRLRNRAIGDPLFTEWSVREALSDLDDFTTLLFNVQGLGRKSVNELIELLLDVNSGAVSLQLVQDDIGEGPASKFDTTSLDPALLELPLDQILRFHGCSGRLENTLERGAFDEVLLSHYLDDPGLLRKRLDGLSGFGRKTIEEAVLAVERFVEAALAGASAIQAFLAAPAGPGMIGLAADRADARSDEETARPIQPVDPATARARLEEFIASLPERQHHVLVRRYGLEGHAKQTLQEIADDVHVTRERVRQIETQALRRIRLPANHASLQLFLAAHRDEIWALLAGGNELATDNEVREFHRRLDPLQVLAIDSVHDGLRQWLDHNATRIDTGWLHKSADASQIDADRDRIAEWLRNHPGPRLVDFVRDSLHLTDSRIDLAAEHSSEISVFDAYLVEGRVGARSKRTIRLHALAVQLFRAQPFDIATLAAEYRRTHAQDDVASRMFQMQMEEAPHLFCRLFDNIWFALGAATPGPSMATSVPFDRENDIAASFESGAIGADMTDLMAEGPWRHIDLRVHMVKKSDGRIAASSIGAILSSNPCFRRVAPGIFDIHRPGQSSGDNHILNAVFLNEAQCRAYCQARFGGAPIDWYPAWGPSLELWLTRWARLNAGPELFRSLLAVIEPDSWDAPDDELAYWQRQKGEQAAWDLGAPRKYELGRRLAEPARMLATLAQLAFFGWTSWVAVNRTTDARGDVHDAADLLSILIVAGLVEPSADWQARHAATGKARELFVAACREMHLNGELSWKSGVLGELFSGIGTMSEDVAGGWVDREEFSCALKNWSTGEARSGGAFAPRGPKQVDPEPIFESDDWGSLFDEE